MKGRLTGLQLRRQLQQPTGRIVLALHDGGCVGRQPHHANAMALLQVALQAFAGLAGRQMQALRQLFGGVFEFGNVVVAGGKKVAHFFIRQPLNDGQATAVVAQAAGHGFKLLQRFAVALVQPNQRARHGGHAGGHLPDFGQRYRLGADAFHQVAITG